MMTKPAWCLWGCIIVMSCAWVRGVCQQPDASPVNPEATVAARRLLQQLDALSGKAVLSGEHNYPNTLSRYSDRVYDLTGKYPAIFGQDFGFAAGDDKDSVLSRAAMIQEVIRQYRAGAIPALCWHAVPPTQDEPVTFQGSILSRLSDWEFQQLLTPGTDLHRRWERQVDRVAGYLRELEDAGVPVLFRPYHEMNGNWFWWGGRPGPSGSAALYRMLFDRYVHVHHLRNLLWVWNVAAASSKTGAPEAYWPGPDAVDVVTMDVYRPFVQADYDSMTALAMTHKPVALAEVGTAPSLATLAREPRWSYFMIWAEFAEDHNTPQSLETLLNAPLIVNRGDRRLVPPTGPPPNPHPPTDLQATAGAADALRSLGMRAAPAVEEIDLSGATTASLNAQVAALHRAGKLALLRWQPPVPTSDAERQLDEFEWSELRRPGTALHAAWLDEVEALAKQLAQLPGEPILLSVLPAANTAVWWNRPGVEGTQALLDEVHERLAAEGLHNLLWVWEPATVLKGEAGPQEVIERYFPGPLHVDVYLVDAQGERSERDATLVAVQQMAAGKPVGLRSSEMRPDGGVPYDFLVKPEQTHLLPSAK